MSAPLRIRSSKTTATTKFEREGTLVGGGGQSPQPTPPPSDGLKDYLNRLVKLIPSEVIGLYMIGSGYIDPLDKTATTIWAAACLSLVFVVRIYGTSDSKNKVPPEYPAVFISAGAFLVWLYWLGGPFKAFGIQYPSYASMGVLLFSFLTPYFYKDE